MFKTEKEIFDQYNALERTYEKMLAMKEIVIACADRTTLKGITFIGCGSSYSLCKSADVSTKMRMGIRVNSIAAGDLLVNFAHYRDMIKDTIIVAPSRSGSTSEVVLAVKKAREEIGLKCIAISAKEKSTLGEMADVSIELPWAFDDSVCQTRTVTNLYAANLMLISLISGDSKLADEVGKAIAAGAAFMGENKEALKNIGETVKFSKVVVLADSAIQGMAEEGALAFNEICQIPSNYYHFLDVRHGPMVLINRETLVIAACSPLETSYQRDLVNDLKNKGAWVITISSRDRETWGSDYNIQVPAYENYDVNGIPFIFIPQALSYFTAMARGINPDEPQGLDPWIKL